MLVIPALTIFLSLIFAFILTQGELREKSFYRTVFFFPSVVSMTVVGIVWSFVFNPTRGILNHMLDLFNLSSWKMCIRDSVHHEFFPYSNGGET